jgi:hypothetical protein
MSRRRLIIGQIVCWIIVVGVAAFMGCAGKKAMVKTEEGVMLAYRLPEGKTLTYEKTENATQSMDVMGQSVETKTERTMTFKVTSKGVKDGEQALTLTVEALEGSLETPQGSFSIDAASAIGKSFDMMLSVRGQESSLSGADAIEYSMGLAGTRSIEPDFEAFFPDLPETRVKILGTWPSSDTINMKESGMDVQVVSNNLNVLQGFETIDGRECAKVAVEVNGSIAGAGMQGGADLTFTGDMTGNEVWYFDYNAGVLVKSSSDLSVTATVNVTGPQEMTIPVTQTMHMSADLLE